MFRSRAASAAYADALVDELDAIQRAYLQARGDGAQAAPGGAHAQQQRPGG